MNYTYAERWGPISKRPVKPLTEMQASARHQRRELYAVIIGDTLRPECIVTVNLIHNSITVSFFDERIRPYLEYAFTIENGRLFLQTATEWWFNGETDAVATAAEVRFSTSGHMRFTKTNIARNHEEVGERFGDVSKNWEDMPEFGNYEALIRKGRV